MTMKIPDEAARDLAGEQIVEWSDSRTEEDLSEATAAVVRHFEDGERLDHAEVTQNATNLRP
jgi:hypothetical protein